MEKVYSISEYGEIYYVDEDGREVLADREDADAVEEQLGYVYYYDVDDFSAGEFLSPEDYEAKLEAKLEAERDMCYGEKDVLSDYYHDVI